MFRYFAPLLTLLSLVVMVSCSNEESEPDVPTTTVTGVMPAVANLGGSLNDNAEDVVATSDGGYAVLGYTQSADGDVADKSDTSFDYWLLKYSAQGVLEWSKTYGGNGDDRGNSLKQTSDGGYIMAGYSTSNDGDVSANAGAQDFWLVKTDAMGTIQWERSFGFPGRDEALAVTQTEDLGFVVVGELDVTASQGQGATLRRHAGGNYWALKLDANGTVAWSNFFGGTFTDTAFDVMASNDNGFYIIGSSDSNDVDISNNKGAYDFWIVKIASDGSMLWERNFGGSEIDEARAAIAMDDGSLLVVGDTRSTDKDIAANKGGADVWLVNIGTNGDLLWERTFGGSAFDVGRDICSTSDGDFLIAGSSRSLDGDLSGNNGSNDLWVFQVDAMGNLQQEWGFGGSEIDFGHAVAQLQDGTIVVVGSSSSSDNDLEENKGFTDLLKIELR